MLMTTGKSSRLWAPSGGGGVRLCSRYSLWRALGLMPAISGGTLEVFTQGETITLEALLNVTAPKNLRVLLFTNNHAPAEGDTEASFTEMGAVQSYAYVDLTAGSWVGSGSAPRSYAYPQITWTFTAGGPTSVYGYVVVQRSAGGASELAVWAESFSGSGGPFVVQNAGDQIKVTLNITAD